VHRTAGLPFHVRAQELVRQERISRSAGIEATTSAALEDVQQISDSAFTSAVVFT
jgi:hypothetical protein